MAMHQRACLKGLTAWKKAFQQIKYQPSRVQAVSQLVKFGAEMTEEVGRIQDAPPTASVKKRYGGQPYVRVADRPAPVVSNEAPPDFSGVIEGRNLPLSMTTGQHVAVFEKLPVAFPLEAEILVYGFAPNLRLLMGELPDKRRVSVWKGPRNWRLPSKILCKIDPGSNQSAPVYIAV